MQYLNATEPPTIRYTDSTELEGRKYHSFVSDYYGETLFVDKETGELFAMTIQAAHFGETMPLEDWMAAMYSMQNP